MLPLLPSIVLFLWILFDELDMFCSSFIFRIVCITTHTIFLFIIIFRVFGSEEVSLYRAIES